MPPRFLFLDFDGVLNSLDWAERRPSKEAFALEWNVSPEIYDHDRTTWALRSIDPDAVAALNAIVRRTGARVVVSSTWRTMYALPKLEWMLRQRGFKHHLIGTTPEGQTRIRGEQIQSWVSALDVGVTPADIVIIDDDSDMAELLPRLFKTDARHGLRAEHVDAVAAMFEAP